MDKSTFIGGGLLIITGVIHVVTGAFIIGNIWVVGGLVLMWIGIASR